MSEASDKTYIMAIDAGVTGVKAGLVGRDGRIAHYSNLAIPAQGESSAATVLVDSCRNVLNQAGLTTRDLAAVGCCLPGCVNPDTGVVLASEHASWVGVDVRQPLENSFERRVTMEGAGGTAALASYYFGPSRGQNHILGITIGTGISAGYLLEGKLLRGEGQAALEAGHMQLFPQGRPCSCGRRGCWQAHAGGGALRTLLHEYQQAGYQLPGLPEELAELAHASHETAIAIWEEQGMLLGSGIAVLLNILNPKTVVLAGGMCESWALFKRTLLKAAREAALPRNAEAAIVCAPDPESAAY